MIEPLITVASSVVLNPPTDEQLALVACGDITVMCRCLEHSSNLFVSAAVLSHLHTKRCPGRSLGALLEDTSICRWFVGELPRT